MNLWRSDERADAAAAFDKAFAFEGSEGVARGHEADVMRLGELALGGDGVAGLKLAGIDAFANDALNALIRRQRVWRARGEALDGSQRFLVRSHQLHLAKHSRQRDVSAERNHEEFGVSSVL